MKSRLYQIANMINACSNALGRVTRKRKRKRRRRLRRKHITTTVNVASALTSAVALTVPQARPAAAVLGAVQQATSKLLPEKPDFEEKWTELEQKYLARLQAIEGLLPKVDEASKLRLEEQRDLILRLLEDYERNR